MTPKERKEILKILNFVKSEGCFDVIYKDGIIKIVDMMQSFLINSSNKKRVQKRK